MSPISIPHTGLIWSWMHVSAITLHSSAIPSQTCIYDEATLRRLHFIFKWFYKTLLHMIVTSDSEEWNETRTQGVL